MKRIADSEIEGTLSVADYVKSCDEAFKLYGQGEMISPVRKEEVWRDGEADIFQLEMPALWVGNYRGRKVIREQSNVADGRLGERSATLEIEDLRSGDQFVMDAEYITNMRTGAAGVLGACYLGQKVIQTISILGTGRIARSLALCADAALEPNEIRVTSRSEENRIRFKAGLEENVDARVTIVDSIEACLEGAQAVFASVPTPSPILRAKDLADGVHLSVIAGDPRTSQLEPDLLVKREVVVDHEEQAVKSGDFLSADRAGHRVRLAADQNGDAFTIGDAAMGLLEDRRGEGLVAYFTGMALQDLHAGVTVLKRLGLLL